MNEEEFDRAMFGIDLQIRHFHRFAVVEDESGHFRFFCGGEKKIVLQALAKGLANLCEAIGEDSVLVDAAAEATRILKERRRDRR